MSNFYEAGKAAMTSNKDDWETPQQLFDYLDLTYHFMLDPCSTHENAKCAKHYTTDEDGLAQSWEGETVFCNPPYGRDMYEWVRKCAVESRHAKVVMLIPARTDTRYFHDFIYRKPNVRYEFLRGRLKFEVGGGTAQLGSLPINARVLRMLEKQWRCRRWLRPRASCSRATCAGRRCS